MRRRTLLAGVIAAAAARPALAGRPVALPDAFLLLQDYFKLAPGQRDRFYLAYRAMLNDKPAPGAKATYLAADGSRTPVVFDAGAVIANPPTEADFRRRLRFETDGPPLTFDLELCASIAPAMRLPAPDLAAALAQANAAVTRFTGGAPGVEALTAAFFPDAGTSAVLFASGQSSPLPTFDFKSLGKIAYFEPGRPPAAAAVTFETPPSRIILSRHPRKARP